MKLLLMLFLIIGFASCATYRYIYTASPANNPVFTKKGESKIAGYYSSSSGSDNTIMSYTRGFDVQGAYAISDHLAITASYLNRREKDVYGTADNNFDSSVVNYKRNLAEFGGGYFIPINKRNTLTASVFGGYGTGKFSFTDNGLTIDSTAYSRYHQSKIGKWFFQPAINFIPSANFSASFALKFSYVNYRNIKTNYTPDELAHFSLQNLEAQTLTFTEPSLSIQFGVSQLPWIKVEAIFSGVTQSGGMVLDRSIRTSNISIGLNIDPFKIH